ncbi:MAG TPA: tyrosine-type recombinase/integrase [Armatimonadota bacterium]|jgi:site-specific recombinase XerD
MSRKLSEPVFAGLPLVDLLPPFTAYLQTARRSPATIAQYTWAVHSLDHFLATSDMPRDIARVTSDNISAFQRHLLDTRAAATAQAAARSLRAFYTWAMAEGEAQTNPMERVPKPSAPVVPVEIIPPDWARRLFASAAGNEYDDLRDLAILRLLWDSGGRRAEIGSLRVEDLHWEANVAAVKGKGDKTRTIPFTGHSARALRRYLTQARPRHPDRGLPALWLGANGPMTPDGIRYVLDKRTKLAGLPHLHPHQFRHTMAHRFLAAGGNQNSLMLLMGWNTPQMVARYVASTATELAHSEYQRLGLDDV